MTPEPSKGTPDRIRGDGGLGEAGPWTIYVCPECGKMDKRASNCCPDRARSRPKLGLIVFRSRQPVEVVPAARLAAAEQRAEAWTRETERANRDRQAAEHQVEALREKAGDAFFALLSLLPLVGSVEGGYRISDRIDPTLVAEPEEWASAAQAMLDLLATLAQQGETP
jgi:hypothetical protein